MSDTFTQTSSQSWFSRIGNAFKGMVVGFILFIAAFPLLFWNEGRTIKQTKSLNEAQSVLVQADSKNLNPDNDKKLVYMNGEAKTEETLSDDIFPVSVNAFKLQRNVEMYQWVEESKTETKKNMGGSEEKVTTYSYKKQWTSSPIDSSSFQKQENHVNPQWPFGNNEYVAQTGTFGVFTLSDSLIAGMNWTEPYKVEKPEMPAPAETAPVAPVAPVAPAEPAAPVAPVAPESESTSDATPAAPAESVAPAAETPAPLVTSVTAPAVPAAPAVPETKENAEGLPEGFSYSQNGGFYKGNPTQPQIGDMRVSFSIVPQSVVSIISQQMGDTFAPFQTSYNPVEMITKGVVSSEAMFKSAHNANAMTAWILRVIGFFLMFIGLKMIFAPLATIADVLPIAGTIVSYGTGFIAFVLAAGFSLLTIAMGWVFYRPIIGVPLLIAALVFFLLPFFKGKKPPAPAEEK